VGDPEGVREICAAAQLLLSADAAFSHHTAAELLGIALFDPVSGVHVTVSNGTAVRRTGMQGHIRVLASCDVIDLGGLRVTSAARTFVDLAEVVPRASLVAFGDAMVHARRATLNDFKVMVETHSGRRGVRRAREVLPSLDGRAESPPESILRLLLADHGFPELEVNVNVYDALGRFLARADLLLHAAKVIVEYDGDQHRTSRKQFARDVARGSGLAAAGYLVLRFTASDLFQRPQYVVATVRAALASRGF
jgi:very-short-patch-repair endonuclease